jgi:hypothetical protein
MDSVVGRQERRVLVGLGDFVQVLWRALDLGLLSAV